MGSLGKTSDGARMASYIKRIATGPQRSKDLTRDEAKDGMALILEQRVSEIQAAVFLIALRMKRETDEENLGVMEALRDVTIHATANVPELVDLADPYDGFGRHLPSSPFLPVVLASCGLPTISHACLQVGPKYGVTHRQILAFAGVRTDLTPKQAAERVGNPDVGWAYMDQELFCPSLHKLVELRRLIVKRPLISTLEKLCGPVRASGRNHLLVGYVHKGYEQLLSQVARHLGYDSSMIIRGVEGGIIPPLNEPIDCLIQRKGGEGHTLRWDPKEAGILSTHRAVPLPAPLSEGVESEEDAEAVEAAVPSSETLAEAAASAGLEALSGAPGPTRDSLIYAASAILYSLGRFPTLGEAAAFVRLRLDSKIAMQHFA